MAKQRKKHTDATQPWWKTFLHPGWVITFLLVIAFSYAALTVLSPWQLGKDEAIVSRNEHVEKAYKTDPQPFTAVFTNDGSVKDGQEWMRVTIRGRFLSDKEVLLRLRPVESGPSYQSLVPFQLDDGTVMLINRGWVPTKASEKPDIPTPPSAEMTITANARLNEQKPATNPMNDGGYQQVYGINTQQISELIGVSLGTDYLQLSEDSAGGLNPIPVPKLDRGNHLSYGFQWIAFGIMAPLGLGYMVYSELRERRRVREEEAEMLSAPTAQDHNADTKPSLPSESAQQQSLPTRSRYGNTRPDHYRNKRNRY
ncbi:SURF1 family protein [Corynebacterium sp. sy017]|uniref:SURF1 family cytochrome oxidase biogenesis protein n=1 Tax=unclassified Corynebacterium TaxID=2624378 RepID=UPI001185CF14|nr:MULTISPECIES: SURF1 family protein [unclassified Corynebacterium]MBP3088034.1 SURF1 family protein [Corynebacterium sp. sy017]QDZ42990.1 SURF1 family protein [Corynebacterium sp. sy039]TSD92563.1 SURF1 family protein [Corynebacterium sp. SY003]